MRRFAEFCLTGLIGLGVSATAVAETIPADRLPEQPLAEGAPPVEAEYLRKLHAHIHRRWATNFLRLVGESLPLSNPLNEGSRTAEVDFAISSEGLLLSST